MAFIFKWLKRLVLVGLVCLVVLVLARNFVAQQAAEIGVRAATGFPLQIGQLDLGWGRVQLADLRLLNPKEFPEPAFVEMRQMALRYEPASLLKFHPRVSQLDVQITELVLVTNEEGLSNVQRLTQAGGGKPAGGSSAPGKKQPFQVEVMNLQVGTVRFLDLSKGRSTERKMVLNLNTTFRDINQDTDLTALVLRTVLGNVRIPELKGVTEQLNQSTGGVAESLQKAGEGLLKPLRQQSRP